MPQNIDANEALDPRRVRSWLAARRLHPEESIAVREFTIQAALERPSTDYLQLRITVLPLEAQDQLLWIDPAGYKVARSERPLDWPQDSWSFDFELTVLDAVIVGNTYLRHT